MNKIICVAFLSIVSISAFAQHSIQGKVLDKNNEGTIEMATVSLLDRKDSALVEGKITDAKGTFTLSKIKDGNYILKVRCVGYKNYFTNITMNSKGMILKNIYLDKEVKNLFEVEVKGMAAQMNVKGDTIEYNTAAYKVAENAAVEDLLKKLPGVAVDADGKVTVNGEEIKKVRIDGKKFFDGDVQMATKNIPVDMVDKVQVIDQKSDMAQLTGFEDENTERIINLTIKENRKKGIFGNITGGGGADKDDKFRYDSNVFLNILNGSSQTAIIGGANNTNSMRSGRGRGGMDSGGGGITETQNIGVNNNTVINDKLTVGGDASINHTSRIAETSSKRESWIQGATYTNNNESESTRDNHNANVRLEMEWHPDTLTTIIFQPRIELTKGQAQSASHYEYFAGNDSISWGNSSNTSESNSKDAGLNVILSRKSKAKKGRALTLNAGVSLDDSDSEGFNKSTKNTKISGSMIDQRNTNNSETYGTNLRLSYVEPIINLKNFIEIATSYSSSSRDSKKLQYDKGPDGQYNRLDSVYSNNFESLFYNESVEANFRHVDKNYNYMLGMEAEPSQMYSKNYYKNGDVLDRSNEVLNFSPSAQFRYNFGRKKYARLDYRGRTNQPSIDQMQPVKNNDNLMLEPIGNQNLKPSFDQYLRLMYSSFNSNRLSSFSAGVRGNFTRDALVTNSIYDKTGKQYSQTVNSAKDPFNLSADIMYNTPVVKNRLQFNTQSEINYSRRYGYSDRTGSQSPYVDDKNEILRMGFLSDTKNWGGNENLSLTFTTDVIEIGARGSVRYSNTQNNLNDDKLQETWDWTGAGNVNLYLPYDITVANDLSYTTREGYTGYDHNELVWNASIDKLIMKKKGTLSLKVFDILQQRLNIRETIGDNYRQITKYNMLPTYFLLSFSYKIAKFGGGASAEDMFRGSRHGGRFHDRDGMRF